jgi:hypothetical protein
LLVEIKKANTNDSASKQGMDTLKFEVSDLSDRVNMLSDDMDKLTSLVDIAATKNTQQTDHYQDAEYSDKKQRQAYDLPSSINSGGEFDMDPYHPEAVHAPNFMTSYHISHDAVEDLRPILDSVPDLYFGYIPDTARLAQRMPSGESIGAASFLTQDRDMINSLFSLDPLETGGMLDVSQDQSNFIVNTFQNQSSIDLHVVEKLRGALVGMPLDLQNAFIDRLVIAVVEPEVFQRQVDAIASLATSAAEEARRRLTAAGRSIDDPKVIPLASAVLGAYLARYVGNGDVPTPVQQVHPFQPPQPPTRSMGLGGHGPLFR